MKNTDIRSTPVSHTNHPVYRIETGWLKAWSLNDIGRIDSLKREHLVNQHLNIPSILDERGLLTPHFGKNPEQFDAEAIEAVARAIEALPPAPEGLRDASMWAQDQMGFIVSRLPEGPERDACFAHAPKPAEQPPGATFREMLVHTDPHRLNVVIDEQGKARMIDWEAALDGNISTAYACLAHYIIADAAEDVADKWVEMLRNRATDSDVFDWALRTRQASWLSWVFANKGLEQGWERLTQINSLV